MSDENDPVMFESPFHVNHPKDSADQMERMADEFLKERDKLEAEIARLNRVVDDYKEFVTSIGYKLDHALFQIKMRQNKE